MMVSPPIPNPELRIADELPSLLHHACTKIRQPPVLAAVAHGTRDLMGQAVARTIGLAIFTRAASLAQGARPLSIVVGGVGAISAGTQAWMIASRHIGTDTWSGCLGTMTCTGVAAAAGGAIAVMGASQPVIALAVGTTLTVATSLLRICSRNPEEERTVGDIKGIGMFFGTAASLTAVSVIDHQWTSTSDVPARNLGLLGESLTVEFFKSTLERAGPSVNRDALNFNGKALASLAGLLPYLAATVLINGYVSGLLQPPLATDSHSFREMILPVLIGALANAVRGTANATATYLVHAQGIGTADPESEILRVSEGLRKPQPEKIIKKTAIRFFISSCRVAVYTKLRSQGMPIMQASLLSQAVYGVFAQSRDLIFDLTQGDGWRLLHQDDATDGNTPANKV